MVKQLNLFNQPSLNINKSLKEQMALSVRECEWDRPEILERMNDLADRYGVRLIKGNGTTLNMATFEKWVNVGAMSHIPPINSLVIFCAAIGDNRAMDVALQPLGVAVIDENDAVLLQWAKEYQRAKVARQKMKKLESEL